MHATLTSSPQQRVVILEPRCHGVEGLALAALRLFLSSSIQLVVLPLDASRDGQLVALLVDVMWVVA